jgi:negative regulator of sigma E activity
MNKKLHLDAMSVDEMWKLHEEIMPILRELEKRLAHLRHENEMPQSVSSDNKIEKRCVWRAAQIPEGIAKIQKFDRAIRNVVGAWKATALVDRGSQGRSHD